MFGCAVVTVVGAVLNTSNLVAGRTMAVFGLGGVGLNSVMAGTVDAMQMAYLSLRSSGAYQRGVSAC